MTAMKRSRAAAIVWTSAAVIFAVTLMISFASMTKFFTASAAEDGSGGNTEVKNETTARESAGTKKWAYLAAAISVGLGSVATGIAVAHVGAAALGVIAEKPEMAGRALIFVGLAEGIAIYGLLVAILILR